MKHLSKEEESRPWSPIHPNEAYDIFSKVDKPWWIAGGWAIEYFVGDSFRGHDDIDILILRKDQLDFQKALDGWEIYVSDPPGQLRTWNKDEVLPLSSHDIWCRKDSHSDWALQFMLMDSKDEICFFRRDHSIFFSLDEITLNTTKDIPYLAPHVQLLYKSKSLREKDELDFQKTNALLSDDQREWLKGMLNKLYANNHPWISKL